MITDQDGDENAALLAAMEARATLYEEHLRHLQDAKRARDELRQLGLDPAGKTTRAFRLGYAASDADDVCLRDRIILPLINESGHVVAIIGRAIRREARPGKPLPPRYVSSPENSLYDAGRTLYGLHQGRHAIRECGLVVVVEAIIDVLLAHAAGEEDVVAPLGTAFAAEHARLLARYTTRVTIVHDDDHPGRSWAAEVAGACAAEGLAVASQPRPEDDPAPERLAPWSARGFRA